MRTLVLGDLHGSYKGLLQVFERSKFDYEKDTLISLGDVCDGYPQVRECIDELLKIKNLILVIGNHDKWFLDWATTEREVAWRSQGGQATFNSYVPKSHIEIFKNAHAYHIDEKNRLFVHGGFDLTQKDFSKQKFEVLTWDRQLVSTAKKKHYRNQNYKLGNFEEVFVGHTSTTYSCNSTDPQHFCNLWMVDTGAGWEGKLTIMDVDSKEYWQSDESWRLYPQTEQAKAIHFQRFQGQSP